MLQRNQKQPLPASTHRLGIRSRSARILVVLCVIAVVYLAGQYIAELTVKRFSLHMRVSNEPMIHLIIMTAIGIYMLLMMIPFMPGVEVGLSMILFLGPKICLLVYIATLTALTLSYLIGRLMPDRYSAAAFTFLGMTRAAGLVEKVASLNTGERLALLQESLPQGLAPRLLRHRYLALAVLLNLPGNMVIGGGGGIALLAGMSGLFPLLRFLLTIILAVAPVPLMITLTETGIVG